MRRIGLAISILLLGGCSALNNLMQPQPSQMDAMLQTLQAIHDKQQEQIDTDAAGCRNGDQVSCMAYQDDLERRRDFINSFSTAASVPQQPPVIVAPAAPVWSRPPMYFGNNTTTNCIPSGPGGFSCDTY
jgi:hypothetical protein